MTTDYPAAPGQPFTRAEAHRAGLSDRALAAAVRRGELVRMRRGWYHSTTPDMRRREVTARQVSAALHQGPAGAVASHRTAAALHGLPLLRSRSQQAHLTVDRPNGGRGSRHVRLHGSPPGPLEVTDIDGIPVTSVARTVVDLSRTEGFRAGVCAAETLSAQG